MNTKEIKSQKEYEENKNFDGILIIKNAIECIILRENSRAELWGNSTAVLWENSRAVLRENSRAVLWGNSTAVLREKSTAVLWENSRAVLWENSRAELREKSRAVLWGNSTAVLRENSRADGMDNASILKYNNNKIKLYGNASAKDYIQPVYDRDILNILPDKQDKKIILYKCVDPADNKDFYSHTIKYEIGKETICPDFDNDPERECGGGLHLCFTALETISFNKGKILKCLVNKRDIVIYKYNIQKVRCRKVLPIAEVNLHGDEIKQGDFKHENNEKSFKNKI
jgi:hypothetical protein